MHFALKSRRMVRAHSCALYPAVPAAVSEDPSFLWSTLFMGPNSSREWGLCPIGTNLTDLTESAELIEARRSSADDSEGHGSGARIRASRETRAALRICRAARRARPTFGGSGKEAESETADGVADSRSMADAS